MVRIALTSVALLASSALFAQTPTTSKPTKVADPDRQICKRYTETGSLAKQVKVCKSKREWDRDRDNINAGSVGSGACNSNAGAC